MKKGFKIVLAHRQRRRPGARRRPRPCVKQRKKPGARY
jgi:hypothetical protein